MMRDLLSEVEHQLLWAFIAFVVFLLLGQIWARYANPTSRALKKLDYAWLTLALFALFPAVAEQRALFAPGVTERANNWTQGWVNNFFENVDIERRHACDMIVVSKKSVYGDPVRTAQWEINCGWFGSLQNTLDTVGTDISKRTEKLRSLTLEPPAEPTPETRAIATKLRTVQADLGDHQRLLSIFERAEWERILVWLSPYFLALGLAIRFAKVTGELCSRAEDFQDRGARPTPR